MSLDARQGAQRTIDPPLPAPPSGAQVSSVLLADVEDVFTRARPRLIHLAHRHGLNTAVAEDIAQETLITAWTARATLRHTASVDAWIDGICHNLCLRAKRAAASTHEISESALRSLGNEEGERTSLLAAVSDNAEDPLDLLTRRELIILVERALGHLNSTARSVVELRYLADVPTAEAAARLGVSVNTFEVRLSRARKQLQTVFHRHLRDDAIACGLLLAPADAAGWRDTSLWCHVCGQDRLQGQFEMLPDRGRHMRLRCPRCWRVAGSIEADVEARYGLEALKTFRPAFKRLMQMGMAQLLPALHGPTPCATCGRSIQASVIRGDALQAWAPQSPLYRDRRFVVLLCQTCDPIAVGASGLAGLGSPAVGAFMATHERWMVESEAAVDFHEAPAVRFTLRDRSTGDRMSYVADVHTLEVLEVVPR
jgi:RNA polymerase sigma factor (sigma-70 family)